MNNLDKFDTLSATEQKIIEAIKSDPVPVIPQTEINAVCKVASSYYTEKQNILDMGLWEVILSCYSIEAVFFWILSAFLLGSCVMIVLLSAAHGINPIAVMPALAPVPVIAFAIRELQYRDANLVQIEKTCKYTPEKIYFARLWLGMLLNAVLVLLAGTIVFSRYENITQLYLCSFITMFFVGAVALLLMSLSDSTLPLSVCMSAWVLGSIFFLSENEFISVITQINVGYLAIIMLFSIGAFTVVTVNTTRKLYA